MEESEQFIRLSGLLCEPTRARMLWNLLDGRAYTAGELATAADVSPTSASNHLSKLLEADMVCVQSQGRHRYYSFARPEVAYVVESLAHLAGASPRSTGHRGTPQSDIEYCRSCYDHTAGRLGVQIAEALERNGYLASDYSITEKGWEWATTLGLLSRPSRNCRRPLARRCLDWSERKPHVAGQLGASLLSMALAKDWFRKIQYSRALLLTPRGRQGLQELLALETGHLT